jgi:Uma2 family endonuclease
MRPRVADDVLKIPLPQGVSGFEFVDGKPVPVTPVGDRHGALNAELAYLLKRYVLERGIAGRVYVDAGYVLGLQRDPERMRAPDVSFVSEDNRRHNTAKSRRAFLRLIPELIIEIHSPHSGQVRQRVSEFLEAGTRLAWVIDPTERTAIVYRADGSTQFLHEPEELTGEDVLPGLRVSLTKLFNDVEG